LSQLLSKVINCRILQFLHQMFNMSAVRLAVGRRTLQYCVLTEVFLFSIVALKTLIFHKVV